MDKRQHSDVIRRICDNLIRESKEKYGYASCYYCRMLGRPDFISENAPRNSNEGAQVDHIKSLSTGGPSSEDNYALIHGKCNNEKKKLPLDVALRKEKVKRRPSRQW